MHGLGHSLGLDVHDVSNGQSILKENSVFTVEPGIYIPRENWNSTGRKHCHHPQRTFDSYYKCPN